MPLFPDLEVQSSAFVFCSASPPSLHQDTLYLGPCIFPSSIKYCQLPHDYHFQVTAGGCQTCRCGSTGKLKSQSLSEEADQHPPGYSTKEKKEIGNFHNEKLGRKIHGFPAGRNGPWTWRRNRSAWRLTPGLWAETAKVPAGAAMAFPKPIRCPSSAPACRQEAKVQAAWLCQFFLAENWALHFQPLSLQK